MGLGDSHGAPGGGPSGTPGGGGGRGGTAHGSTGRANENARLGKGGQVPTGPTDPATGLSSGLGGGYVDARDDPGVQRSAPTARDRARAIISRQTVAGEKDLGIGTGYSHVAAMTERAKAGELSPREHDIALGMVKGRESQLAADASTGMLGKLGSAMGLGPVASKTASRAATEAIKSASVPDNPEAQYGATVARNRAERTTTQNVASAAAGLLAGAPGAMAANAINTAVSAERTSDIGELGDALGHKSNSNAPSGGGPDMGGSNSTVSTARNNAKAALAPKGPNPNFGSGEIDMDRYSRGLLSAARF